MQSMLGSSFRGLPTGRMNHEQTFTPLKSPVPAKHHVFSEGGQWEGGGFRKGRLGAALGTAGELSGFLL